jgi:hypothetical protein
VLFFLYKKTSNLQKKKKDLVHEKAFSYWSSAHAHAFGLFCFFPTFYISTHQIDLLKNNLKDFY